MAKNKRSKILAMALCASVMTGIYASPVMAEDLSVNLDGQGIVAIEEVGIGGEEHHDVTGTLTIAGSDIATALTDTNLTLNSVTANTISTTGNTVVGGTLTATGAANLNGGLTVKGGLNVNDGPTVIDGGRLFANKGLTVSSHGISIEAGGDLSLEDGDVYVGGTLDVNGETTLAGLTAGATTVDSLGVTNNATVGGTLEVTGDTTLAGLTAGATTVDSLKSNGNATVGGTLAVTGDTTLAGLTAGATTVDSLKSNGNAEVGGTLAVTGDTTLAGLKAGATTVDSLTVNGAATVDSLEVAKGIEAANGKFQLTEAGVLTVNGEAAFTKGVTVQNGLSVAGDSSVAGDFAVINGDLSVTNGGLTVSGDTKLNGNFDVGAGNFKVDEDGNTTFNGNLNIGHGNFTVDAATGNTVVKGSLKLGSLEGREVGQAIKDLEAYAGDLKDANLPDKVGGIERDPEDAGDPGNGTTTIENGAEFTETAMTMGDTIVESGKITVGAEGDQTIIDGGAITAKSLLLDGKDVGKTIFGIEREDDVTTIEGATSFDADGMSIKDADGFGTSLGVAGMDITATGGLKTSFTAGGATFVGASGTTTINGGAIETTTINGVNFTQWHDEVDGRLDDLEYKTQNIKPGAGTGTGTGEGGTAAGESNNIIDVPATEDGHTGINGNVTVGGKINAGGGTIGDVTMSDGNINTDGVINAGSGNIGGVEMNDNRVTAGSGNVGGVEMNDNRVTADSGNIGGVEMNDNRVTADSGNIGGVEMNDNRVTADSGNIGGVEMNDNTVTADKGAFKDVTVDNSVTVAGGSENKTTINNDGITVGDKGTSIKNDSIRVGDGGYIGGGDVVSGEGVSLNQTAERVGHLENRVGELEDRVDKVGAMSAAIANLRTMGYDPAAPTEVAVGIGQYRDETGAALGLFHYPNRDFMLSLSVSTAGDEVMGGIGATWKFGRKSPEKVAEIKKAQAEADARRAEEAKLAKAEEMKQAAKEAKIKAQQERHAKLAAERAAQAEAAK